MARLPALVDALVLHDPRGKPTIAHIARQVRSAGLIESTKRGAGGADMTFADAVTLLLATCGDVRPQRAVDAVKNLRSLRPAPEEIPRDGLSHELSFMAGRQSFSLSLELLIEHAPTLAALSARFDRDSLFRHAGKYQRDDRPAADYTLPAIALTPVGRVVRVVFYSPGLFAEIHLGRLAAEFGDVGGFHEYYAPPAAWNVGRLDPDAKRRAVRQSDLVTSMEVGLPTLLALHDAVKAPSQSGRPRKRLPD